MVLWMNAIYGNLVCFWFSESLLSFFQVDFPPQSLGTKLPSLKNFSNEVKQQATFPICQPSISPDIS